MSGPCASSLILAALAALAGVLPSVTSAQAIDTDSDRGWFFYRERVAPDPVEPLPPLELQPQPASPTVPPPPIGSVAWIRENIDRLRDRAIDEPTQENVELFAYVQRLMMDKSEVFARTLVQVNQRNPALDETIATPVNSPARLQMSQAREEAQSQILQALSEDTVIWYFFRSDCPYCHRQNPILKHIRDHYGVRVLAISIDGLPLQDGAFLDWVPDRGQASFLGITATPAIFLMHAPDRVVLVSLGMRSLPELVDRIVEVARSEQWIDEGLYQRAMFGLPRRYLTEGFTPDLIEDPDDPAQLLAALRASSIHGATSGTVDPETGEVLSAAANASTPLATPVNR